uniref:Uncharacterized protein n=1 Tax=Strongyloides papillosus TaxID=174720 RepID=A0A0N5C289_STREA
MKKKSDSIERLRKLRSKKGIAKKIGKSKAMESKKEGNKRVAETYSIGKLKKTVCSNAFQLILKGHPGVINSIEDQNLKNLIKSVREDSSPEYFQSINNFLDTELRVLELKNGGETSEIFTPNGSNNNPNMITTQESTTSVTNRNSNMASIPKESPTSVIDQGVSNNGNEQLLMASGSNIIIKNSGAVIFLHKNEI